MIKKTGSGKRSMRSAFSLMVVIFLFLSTSPGISHLQNISPAVVNATVETEPVPHERDSADDPLIWIHPTDPSLSTVMGNDKRGAYEVYDLNGQLLQSIPMTVTNTDIRYNFPLGNEHVALVVGYSHTKGGMIAWKVNPDTRFLEDVTATGAIAKPEGGALYHSQVSGKYYWFSNTDGVLSQYELLDDGSGKVTSSLVRTEKYGTKVAEGTVADDVHGFIYVSEETTGLWRLPAEPDGGSTKVQVDIPAGRGGHFTPDLEGLTIYYMSDGEGYLFASSQGNNTYNVYQRGGNNEYIGTFTIGDGGVDGTSQTDGIDVTNFPLGSAFPFGIFVAQDGVNIENGNRINQNFKIVPFERIAEVFNLPMDTSWDPRAVGQ